MSKDYDDIFGSDTSNEQVEILDIDEQPPVEVKNEMPKKKKLGFDFDFKNDKVLMTQIILFGVWAILTIIIYFFGYPLFEPFINV